MQISSVHLRNIKSHRDTEIHFSPGINVLSGPNGVGKSTVFEAIGYALFGVDAQSFVGNVDRFLAIGARKGEVAVEFQVAGGERYRASRTVGTPSKWLLAKEVGGAFEVEEHKDAKETEARLRELLGLDNGRPLAEQFELVIGPFQNEFLGPFVIRQATRRRDRFDEILGIDIWRRTFNETKSLASAIKAKVEVLESALGPLQEQVADLPGKAGEHEGALRDLEQNRQELSRQRKALQDLEARLNSLDLREERIRGLGVDIEKLRGRIESGREKILDQRRLVEEAEGAQRVLTETRAGKAAYEQAEARLAELREQVKTQRRLEQEAAELDKELGRLGERFDLESRVVEQAARELAMEEKILAGSREKIAVEDTLESLATRLPEIRNGLDVLRKQLGQLQGLRAGLEEGSEKLAEGICPFFREPCLNLAERPSQDAFSGRFAELEGEERRLNKAIAKGEEEERAAVEARDRIRAFAIRQETLSREEEKLKARKNANEDRARSLQDVQREQEEARAALAEKQAALKGYGRLQADIEAAEAEKLRHQEARDRFMAHQNQALELEERRSRLGEFEELFTNLKKELIDREGELKETAKTYDPGGHQALRRHQGELGQAVGALGEKVAGLQVTVERLAREIERLRGIEREIAGKRARIEALGRKEELVKFLRNRVFRNVSGYLSERFREEIGLRADRIYRTIAETDEELRWGEDYRIVLRDMADGEIRERSDDQLSGGQTMSAVVALRLALLQTIGARTAFFDEPTSNLDAVRRENLAHAFRAIDVGKEEVTEHWYDQLFLISHDVAFAEVTDQVIVLG